MAKLNSGRPPSGSSSPSRSSSRSPSRSRSRSLSYCGSDSRSSSHSRSPYRSPSRSFSSSSPSRSPIAPPRRKRKLSPVPRSLVLHVYQPISKVNENLLKEIFGYLGEVVNVQLANDHMAQIDGQVVRAKFTLPERKKALSPPKVVPSTSKRDSAKADTAGPDVDKDMHKRQREECGCH